eukprot:Selendium_serpulae@DN4084_c0_g1_i4.p1
MTSSFSNLTEHPVQLFCRPPARSFFDQCSPVSVEPVHQYHIHTTSLEIGEDAQSNIRANTNDSLHFTWDLADTRAQATRPHRNPACWFLTMTSSFSSVRTELTSSMKRFSTEKRFDQCSTHPYNFI